jgi:hypothetical protein
VDASAATPEDRAPFAFARRAADRPRGRSKCAPAHATGSAIVRPRNPCNRRPTADRDPPGMPLHRCASFVACLMARVASNRWRIFLQAELSAPSPGLTEIGRTRESTFGLASALRCRLVSAPTHVEVDGARRRDRRYDYSSLSFVRRVVVGSRSRGSLDRCGYRGGT